MVRRIGLNSRRRLIAAFVAVVLLISAGTAVAPALRESHSEMTHVPSGVADSLDHEADDHGSHSDMHEHLGDDGMHDHRTGDHGDLGDHDMGP